MGEYPKEEEGEGEGESEDGCESVGAEVVWGIGSWGGPWWVVEERGDVLGCISLAW